MLLNHCTFQFVMIFDMRILKAFVCCRVQTTGEQELKMHHC